MQKLTDEQVEEMYALRVPTVEELKVFAEICDCERIEVEPAYVRIVDGGYERWDPLNNDKQNHRLLKKLIALADCKLFYDDGVDEYFIYQYTGLREQGPPLAHRKELNEAVIEAALEHWFPQD